MVLLQVIRGGGTRKLTLSTSSFSQLNGHFHSHQPCFVISNEHFNETIHGIYKEYAVFDNKCFKPLTSFQKALMVVGTGVSAFLDPTRAESIAVFGEVTAGPVLSRIYENMLDDPEGAEILREKPRINSNTIVIEALSKLPANSFGRAYYNFLQKNQVTPDSRLQVQFIKDPELAYVMQRYREVHDLVHTVTGQPTNMLGEVAVKWIEAIQTGLPMCVTGGLFGATRLRPKQRQKYIKSHLPWAINVGLNSRSLLNIYYEKRWNDPIEDLRSYISPYLEKIPK